MSSITIQTVHEVLKSGVHKIDNSDGAASGSQRRGNKICACNAFMACEIGRTVLRTLSATDFPSFYLNMAELNVDCRSNCSSTCGSNSALRGFLCLCTQKYIPFYGKNYKLHHAEKESDIRSIRNFFKSCIEKRLLTALRNMSQPQLIS